MVTLWVLTPNKEISAVSTGMFDDLIDENEDDEDLEESDEVVRLDSGFARLM